MSMGMTARWTGICLAAGWLAILGCGKKTNEVVAIRMSGGDIPLSVVRTEFERVNGADSFTGASQEARIEFAETLANKEILLREARKSVREPSLRTRVQLTRYRERFLDTAFWRKMSEDVSVPEDTIAVYLRKQMEQRLVSVIQVPSAELAGGLLAKLRGGESFETLARLHSTHAPTRNEGGRLGWVGTGGQVLPAVVQYAFEHLDAGEVSPEPLQTAVGFHIVRVDDVRMQDATADQEQQWRSRAALSFHNNLSAAIRDSLTAHHRLQIRPEAVETLRRMFFSYWDSLNTIQQSRGGVDYLTLEPPGSRYLTPEEWSMDLLSFSEATWTVRDFNESLRECDLEFWPSKTASVEPTARAIERRMLRWFTVHAAVAWGWEDSTWFKERLGRREERQILEDYVDQVLSPQVAPSAETIRKYFDDNPEQFLEKDIVNFGFIQYMTADRRRAEDALARLRQGKAWEEVGQQETLGHGDVVFVPSTGVGIGDRYPALAREAKRLVDSGALPLNTYGDPVEVDGSSVIFVVFSRVPGTPVSWEVAQLFIRVQLTEQAVERLLMEKMPELRSKHRVEVVEEAFSSEGGATTS